jgi:hypothetical protein
MEPTTTAQPPIRIILAVLAGLLAAAFGAWFWMKVNTIPPRYIFFGAGSVVIGFLVGAAVRAVIRRSDIRLAVLAGLFTACGQAGGYYWSIWENRRLMALANGYSGISSITIPLSSIRIELWLMFSIGIYVACSLVMRGTKRAVVPARGAK